MTLLAAICLGAFSAFVVTKLVTTPSGTGRTAPRGDAIAAAGLARRAAASRIAGSARVALARVAAGGLGPLRFWGAAISGGAAVFLVVAALTGSALIGVVPAVAVAAIPATYSSRQTARRIRELQVAWPDGLRDLLASVTVGRSLGQAVTDLAEAGPPPLREAFARFPALARTVGVVEALELVRGELGDPTCDRVIEVLMVAHERGGAIVREIVEDLVTATTRDVKVLEEVETEGLEMRINARAVLVLPWLVLVALTARPGAFREFYASTPGGIVIVAGIALSLVGYGWVRRLGRSEPEQRVFGDDPREGRRWA